MFVFYPKVKRKKLVYQVIYRVSRELNARHESKTRFELGNQERKDLGLVNEKMGGSLEGLKHVPTSVPIFGRAEFIQRS